MTRGFSIFETAIGRCGVLWSVRGVARVQLPEASARDTRRRLLGTCQDAREMAPPPHIQRVIDAIVELLAGGASDLSAAVLDMEGVPPFHRRVYEVVRDIPCGATQSYGEIARRLGDNGAARAVGQAMGRNPFPLIVPCHRVLAAGGQIGGFSAAGGTTLKRRLLAIERAASHPQALLAGL